MRNVFIVKELIKDFLGKFDLSIVKNKKIPVDWNEIDVVYDVGANIGQFASRLRSSGFSGLIVSFEPMKEEHTYLTKRSIGDKSWIVIERCAVGSTNSKIDINVSKNSYSSSILEVGETHVNSAPTSKSIGVEHVDLRTLDSFDFGNQHRNLIKWLKIDVQGYEMEVLKGARSTLSEITGIQVELSTVQLYLGQPLFHEVANHLYDLGFKMIEIQPGFRDKNSGQLLQFDAYFLRKSGT